MPTKKGAIVLANAKSYSLGPGLSTAEQVAGFCYLPFYVVLLALGIEYLSGLLGLGLTQLQLNVVYFVLNCIMIWVIFHNFLLRSFRAIRFWELVQALILGFCLYYAGNLLCSLLVQLLKLQIPSYNDETVVELLSQSRWVMLACTIVLAPMVEETLFRGLIFGVLRRQSRIAAYAVTILLFAAVHVWQYLLVYDPGDVLLSAVQYIPAGIALGWTYEKCNTVWGPIFLHMLINAISAGVLSLL